MRTFLFVLSLLFVFAFSVKLYAQADAAIIVANDNKNFAQELKKYTDQIKSLTELVEDGKEQLDKLKEQLGFIKTLQNAVGEAQKTFQEYKDALPIDEIQDIVGDVNEFQETCKDIYGVYDDSKKEFEGVSDSFKKFQSLSDLRKIVEGSYKKMSSKREKILEVLQKLGNDAQSGENDARLQKVQALTAVQSATLREVDFQEQKYHNRLVEQHMFNINDQELTDRVETSAMIEKEEEQMKNFNMNMDFNKDQKKMLEHLY